MKITATQILNNDGSVPDIPGTDATARTFANRVQNVDTLAALQALDPTAVLEVCCRGRVAAFDGGGDTFFSRAKGIITPDSHMRLQSDQNAAYIWERIVPTRTYRVSMFGVFGSTLKSTAPNETTGIQAAFTWIQTNGGILEFEEGKYYQVTTAITITAAHSWAIRGRGATIFMANSAANTAAERIIKVDNCTNWYIEDLQIDGNKSNRTLPGTGETGANHALTIIDSHYFRLTGVYAYNNTADGCYIVSSDHTDLTKSPSNFVISQCRFTGNFRQGMSIINARYATIEDSLFSQNGPDSPAAGLDIEANPGAATGTMEEIIVRRNTFDRNTGKGCQISGVGGSSRVILTENAFVGNGNTQTNELLRLDAPNCVAKHNSFRSFGNLASATAVCHVSAINVTVEENDFIGDSAATTWTPGDAVVKFFSGGSFGKCRNNRFINIVFADGHNKPVIETHSSNTHDDVIGNTFYNCKLLSASAYTGMIQNSAADSKVLDNVLWNAVGTSSGRRGIYSTGARAIISKNNLTRQNANMIWNQGASSMVTYNHMIDLVNPSTWIQVEAGGVDSWLVGNYGENVGLTATTNKTFMQLSSGCDPMALRDNIGKKIHATNAYVKAGTPRLDENNITVA